MSSLLARTGLPMIVDRVRFSAGTGVTRMPTSRHAAKNGASNCKGASTTTAVPIPLATMKEWRQVSSTPLTGRIRFLKGTFKIGALRLHPTWSMSEAARRMRSSCEERPVTRRRSTQTPARARSLSAGVCSSSLVVRAASLPRGGGRCRMSQGRAKRRSKWSKSMQQQQKARTNLGFLEIGARLRLP